MKIRRHFPCYLLICTLLYAGITSCGTNAPGTIPVNPDSVKSHILPISEAIRFTTGFRDRRDYFYGRISGLKDSLNFGQAESFNRDAVAILLNQKDSAGNQAAGIRIYYGLDQAGAVRMVLVPYDAHGNDIVNQLINNNKTALHVPGIQGANAAPAGDGQTIENGQRCPVICDNGTSGLNR